MNESILKKISKNDYLILAVGFILSVLAGKIGYDDDSVLSIFMHWGFSLTAFIICVVGVYSILFKYDFIQDFLLNAGIFLFLPAFPAMTISSFAYGLGSWRHNYTTFLYIGLIGTGILVALFVITGTWEKYLNSNFYYQKYRFLRKSIRFAIAVIAMTLLVTGNFYVSIFFTLIWALDWKIPLIFGAKAKEEAEEEKRKEELLLREEQKEKPTSFVQPVQHRTSSTYSYFTPNPSTTSQSNETKRDEIIRKVGEEGEKRVNYGLKMLQDFEGYKTYSNFYIVADNGFYQQIDHMAVGESGVFHLETKTFSGEYEIDADGNWFKVYKGQKEARDNPFSQMERHEMVLNSILKDVLPKGVKIQHILSLGTENVGDIVIKGKENAKYPIIHHKDLTSYIKNYQSDVRLTDIQINEIHRKIMKHLRAERPTLQNKTS